MKLVDAAIEEGSDLLELTSHIVAAYVGHNALSNTDLRRLIGEVHHALKSLGSDTTPAEEEPLRPAVSVRKSITPDYLICLDDGKKFKTLKRHLLQLGMTPAQYRDKWKLPIDYPMVAPNYSTKRSSLAKSLGLGRKPATAPTATARKKQKAANQA